MAEQGTSTALVPVIEGEYLLEARQFDAAGKSITLKAPLPTTAEFARWSLLQQAIMLKSGSWSQSPLNEIVFAIAYAQSKGLDILAGDVYSTGSGRIATSNKAKIKLALATDRIEGIETDIKALPEKVTIGGQLQNDLECTAVIHVKGWKNPIVRKARLSRWYNARNPNWKDRPEHMLELNTVAHALEYINPVATEDDEAPPIPQAQAVQVKEALAEAVKISEPNQPQVKEN
jgi:hypothetical protein